VLERLGSCRVAAVDLDEAVVRGSEDARSIFRNEIEIMLRNVTVNQGSNQKQS
jgi:hypothetical protein